MVEILQRTTFQLERWRTRRCKAGETRVERKHHSTCTRCGVRCVRTAAPPNLVPEGQVGEDREVLGPLDGHEEQAGGGLVDVLRAAGVEGHVVLRGGSLGLVTGHVDVLVHWEPGERQG